MEKAGHSNGFLVSYRPLTMRRLWKGPGLPQTEYVPGLPPSVYSSDGGDCPFNWI
jgi:hypothetical protein